MRIGKSLIKHKKVDLNGLIFVAPWILGILLFFLFPICKSIYFCFGKILVDTQSIDYDFIGFQNFDYIINRDANYLTHFASSLTEMAYSLPSILIVSLVLAVVLNQEFKGRLFFRGLFFLPVIIASGVVIDLIFTTDAAISTIGTSEEAAAMDLFDVNGIIADLGLPSTLATYLQIVLNEASNIIWNSGVQTLLFISGLQSIPPHLYEVAKVEGCTKWEEFWLITLPMLGRVILLVIVYTVVDLLTQKGNALMSYAYNAFNTLEYGAGSAMVWLYFLVIGAILGAVLFLYTRLCLKRWE